MKKSAIITDIAVILTGVFTLYIGYALLSGLHSQTLIEIIWGHGVSQTPAIILFAIGGVFALGLFAVIYAALCLRKGISCIRF